MSETFNLPSTPDLSVYLEFKQSVISGPLGEMVLRDSINEGFRLLATWTSRAVNEDGSFEDQLWGLLGLLDGGY